MQQQRVVRALHLQEMAACFDAEAATWRLLWHLYGVGSRTYPGGLGSPKLPGCSGVLTVAQHIAATLEQDAELNRWNKLGLPLRCNVNPAHMEMPARCFPCKASPLVAQRKWCTTMPSNV